MSYQSMEERRDNNSRIYVNKNKKILLSIDPWDWGKH